MRSRPAARGVDGVWWPRSRDAVVEFPDLVLVMSSWVGPVCRIAHALDDWDVTAREVVVEGWVVELVGDVTVPRHTVLVTGTRGRRRGLLVVPSDTPGRAARAVLRAATHQDVAVSVEDLLTGNGVPVGSPGDGGAVPPGR